MKQKQKDYKTRRSTTHKPQKKGGARRIGVSGKSGMSNHIKAIRDYKVVKASHRIKHVKNQTIGISDILTFKTKSNGIKNL